MKCGKSYLHISNAAYILCKRNNGLIFKNTIIKTLHDSFKLVLLSKTFNNQQLSITNIYVTSDLAFLVILLSKEYASPKWCIQLRLRPKVWLVYWPIEINFSIR